MTKLSPIIARLICGGALASGTFALAETEADGPQTARVFQPAQTHFTQYLDSENRDNIRRDILSQKERAPTAGMRLATEEDTKRGVPLQETFLNFNGYSTFLPKGALLNLPEHLKKRVDQSPTGTLVAFPDFLRKNPAWVMTFEISLEVAKGEEELAPAKMKFVKNSGRIVISTHQKNPIAPQNS